MAPPLVSREPRGPSQELVDDAMDGARVRGMVDRPGGERIPDEVIDQLLAGARAEDEIAGRVGLLAQLTSQLVERAMEVELTGHLGYEPHQEPPGGTGNTRNGTSPKTLITEQGKVPIDGLRDRDGSFQPKIVRKRQRRLGAARNIGATITSTANRAGSRERGAMFPRLYNTTEGRLTGRSHGMIAAVIGSEGGALSASAQSDHEVSPLVARVPDNRGARIVRRFGIARTVIVVVYLVAVLSGATTSSLGISVLRVNPAKTSDQIGAAQPIRSDEYLTGTPLDLATLADGTKADTPLSTLPDLIWQIPSNVAESVVFWDGNLLRLGSVLPQQMLFAAWWWLPTLLLLLCMPPLLMRLGSTRELAWLAAVVTIAAPASAWWSLWPVRVLGFAVAGCLAMLVAADRLGERRFARAALLGAMAAVLFSRLPTFYVPWSLTTGVPLVLATTGLLVWRPRSRWPIVGLCGGVLLGAVLLWGLMLLVDSTAVHAELNTIYPGLRRTTGALLGPDVLFGAPALGYLQTGQVPLGTNQSELSSAYTFVAAWAGLLWLAVNRPGGIATPCRWSSLQSAAASC